jgi:transposase
MEVTTIGLDLAKNIFQVHGVDSAGGVAIRRRLRRSEVLSFFGRLSPCLIGVEACASAHYWARELAALGHKVKLIPPAYVKAHAFRGKSDAIDAAAICAAVSSANTRFVPLKTPEQQASLSLHRVREQLIGQRTRYINLLRSQMAEFGMIAKTGPMHVAELTAIVADANDARLPPQARIALREVAAVLEDLAVRITAIDKAIVAGHKADATSQRLASQPGVGPIIASAFAASVPAPKHFRSARHFAASLGLTPKQHSTGGKERLGRISKMGNRYLRMLLVLGATSRLAQAKRFRRPEDAWVLRLLARRPARVVITAIANKMARVMWALLSRGETYRASAA